MLSSNMRSLSIIITTSSDPYVTDSTMCCLLLCATIKELLTNSKTLLCELLVRAFPVWLSSTKYYTRTAFSNSSGMSWDSSSLMYPWNSVQSESLVKHNSSTQDMLRWKTTHFVGCPFKKCTILYNDSLCPTLGDAWYCDKSDTSMSISTSPSFIAHCRIHMIYQKQDAWSSSYFFVMSSLDL